MDSPTLPCEGGSLEPSCSTRQDYIGHNSLVLSQDIGALELILDGFGGTHSFEVICLRFETIFFQCVSFASLVCTLNLISLRIGYEISIQMRLSLRENADNGIYKMMHTWSESAFSAFASSFGLLHTHLGHINSDYVWNFPPIVSDHLTTVVDVTFAKRKQYRESFLKQSSQLDHDLLSLFTWIYMDLCHRFLLVGACISCLWLMIKVG